MIKILDYNAGDKIFERNDPVSDVSGVVSEIIDNVIKKGDKALFEYSEKFDRAKLESLEVTKEEIESAYNAQDKRLIEVLCRAAENIRRFHSNQVRRSFILNDEKGIVTGQKVMPLEKVGIYVPGGTAAYPSTVLMNCIPAKIAGVSEVIMVTPAGGGSINGAILAAAKIAGVDRIFKIGGAQAIAALAYGTESVPRVDKISGPGNAYVAEAKRQVFGRVSIDMIAGPSEILIVSDEKNNPKHMAADMLSQAEHDRNASAVMVCTDREFAKKVSEEIEKQIPNLSRCDIARESIDKNGKIIVVESIKKAIEISNEIAPEHLELCVSDPFEWLGCVKNAGSVFMGRNCPEALGDYMAGPNHTLPTSGTARFSSPLSVDDFTKTMQYTYYTKDALGAVCDDIDYFANIEGLGAHAKSAVIRNRD